MRWEKGMPGVRMSSTGVSDDVPRKEKQMNMNIRLLAYVYYTA